VERAVDLAHMQDDLLDALDALEHRIEASEASTTPPATPPPATPPPALSPDATENEATIHAELAALGPAFPSGFRLERVPGDYYDRDLEFRRRCLSAWSTSHLCKSMVMENTKDDRTFPGGLPEGGDDDWASSKYVMVIVQYVSKLQAEKIRDFVYEARGGKTPRKKIKFRLAPEEVSDAITGFSHNAVTPIATRTRIPVLLSHRIAALEPDFFWLGAGEVDLKVGFSAREFAGAYGALTLDCTYDD